MRARYLRIGAAPAFAIGLLVPGLSPAWAACEVRKLPSPEASTWPMRAHEVKRLATWQAYRDSARWRLTKAGIVLCKGKLTLPKIERYRLDLVPEAWERYGSLIRAAAKHYEVPAELIISVMVNESGLKPKSHQKYSGYVSDSRTPNRISVGLGATLIGTARYMLGDDAVDRDWLHDPANSIRMIGLYLDRYYWLTGFDPPRTAAAYNAGNLHHEGSKTNRWKLRNHPIGHSIYIDYFVIVTNEAIRMLAKRKDRPRESFASILYGPPEVKVAVQVPASWRDRSGKLVMYRASRAEMGVASSSIIDQKEQSRRPRPKPCRGASCPDARTSEPSSASR